MDNHNIEQPIKLNTEGLKKIFVGGLFIFFDFRINGFNIIPDLLGYIFVLIGLSSLSNYHKKYKAAVPPAIILLILSIFDIYEENIPLEQASVTELNISTVIGLISLVFELFMIYNILIATADIARKYNETELANLLLSRKTLIIILKTIASLGSILLTFLAGNMVVIIIFIAIGLIGQILYLASIYKSYKTLNRKEFDSEEKSYITDKQDTINNKKRKHKKSYIIIGTIFIILLGCIAVFKNLTYVKQADELFDNLQNGNSTIIQEDFEQFFTHTQSYISGKYILNKMKCLYKDVKFHTIYLNYKSGYKNVVTYAKIPNLGKLYLECTDELKRDYIEKNKKLTAEELSGIFDDILDRKISNGEVEYNYRTIEVPFEKKNGEWEIQPVAYFINQATDNLSYKMMDFRSYIIFGTDLLHVK